VQVVVVHKGLAQMAREKAPQAVVLPFDNFMKIPAFDKIMNALQNNTDITED
jgi:mannitol-specific phosphotransferase system IIBC component